MIFLTVLAFLIVLTLIFGPPLLFALEKRATRRDLDVWAAQEPDPFDRY